MAVRTFNGEPPALYPDRLTMPILRCWAQEYDHIGAGGTWPALDFVRWVDGELVAQERARHVQAMHVAERLRAWRPTGSLTQDAP